MQEPIRKIVKEADGNHVRVEIHEPGHEEKFRANSLEICAKEGKFHDLRVKLIRRFIHPKNPIEGMEFSLKWAFEYIYMYFEFEEPREDDQEYLVYYDALFEEIRQMEEVDYVQGHRLYDNENE